MGNKSGKTTNILLVILISKMKTETYVLQMLLKDNTGSIMKIYWIQNSLCLGKLLPVDAALGPAPLIAIGEIVVAVSSMKNGIISEMNH